MEAAMKTLVLKLQRFLVSEAGPTAVEYAVMLALIIVVCLAAITAVGTRKPAPPSTTWRTRWPGPERQRSYVAGV
jgi:pilus assembly protein Flp/PilA